MFHGKLLNNQRAYVISGFHDAHDATETKGF